LSAIGSGLEVRRVPGLLSTHGDFRRLWAAFSLSQLGSQVTVLAVPLAALAVLHASTFQVGLLTALQGVAFLLVGLPAGAWIDRLPRRPTMVVADLARALLLASIPLAAALDVLTLGQLYLVVATTGVATVFFDVSSQSYLPFLLGRDRLVQGNARLETSRSVAYLAGPGAGGVLVQALTAPVAILADAVSFLWSAGWLASIRAREPVRERPQAPVPMRRQIGAGLRLVAGQPLLRAFACYSAVCVLFLSMEHAIDVVFLVRTLGLPPAGVGGLYAVTSVGAVLGALAATRLSRRLGTASTILAAGTGLSALLLLPLAHRGPALACYVLGNGAASFCIMTHNIVAGSLRQTLAPDHLLGRMNATMRFLTWGNIPAGALLGGALGATLGIRPTLWLSAAGCTAAVLFLYAARDPLHRAAAGLDAPTPGPPPAAADGPAAATGAAPRADADAGVGAGRAGGSGGEAGQ
jgi:predicted MFS family arabinose efflux permease